MSLKRVVWLSTDYTRYIPEDRPDYTRYIPEDRTDYTRCIPEDRTDYTRYIPDDRSHLAACHLLWRWYSSTLNIEATSSSETAVYFQRTARRYIPEDKTYHNHRWENLKSYRTPFYPIFRIIFQKNNLSSYSDGKHMIVASNKIEERKMAFRNYHLKLNASKRTRTELFMEYVQFHWQTKYILRCFHTIARSENPLKRQQPTKSPITEWILAGLPVEGARSSRQQDAERRAFRPSSSHDKRDLYSQTNFANHEIPSV
jgi:hypothetical protein